MRCRGILWMTMVALALGGAAGANEGEPLFAPYEGWFKALERDASYRALADNPATATMELVKANVGALTLEADALLFNLEPGLDLKAHRLSSYVMNTGSLVWVGVIEDPGSWIHPSATAEMAFDPANQVILVKNDGNLTGNAHFGGEWYQIRPLRSGGHAVVKVDLSSMPPDHPEEFADVPTVPMRPARQTKADTVIRVMVHYTSSAASASGNINGLIDLAIAETNQAYVNSDVAIDVVLAHKSQVTYTQSGSFSTDLSRYRGTTDSYMTGIHTTRNSVAADVGVLVINNSSSCGLASSIGSTASTAFAAAHWSCITGYYSFGHEIGHLQSARHDPATDPSTSPYAYGHAYRKTTSPSWRTIMAYNCPSSCPRLNYWSNPNKLLNGAPMGTTSQSHNQRVLNQTAATVAGFR